MTSTSTRQTTMIAHSTQTASSAADSQQIIRCGVGAETYGLDMTWVQSVERVDRVRWNSAGGSPAGWLPERAGDVPVFSLAERLRYHTAAKSGAQQRIVLLRSAQGAWGLLVDDVSQVTRVALKDVVKFPSFAGAETTDYFAGVLKASEGLTLLLSPERLHAAASSGDDATFAAVPAHETTTPYAAAVPRTHMSTPPSSSTPTAVLSRAGGRLVVFSVSEPEAGQRPLAFGLSVSQVLEVLSSPPLLPVPGAPPSVRGLVLWRDSPVPVIDLAARLGLPSGTNQDQSGRLLIARTAQRGALLAFQIRAATRMLRLPAPHLPSERDFPFDILLSRAAVELEHETLVIPDLQRLL